jgi:hypothetical protein
MSKKTKSQKKLFLKIKEEYENLGPNGQAIVIALYNINRNGKSKSSGYIFNKFEKTFFLTDDILSYTSFEFNIYWKNRAALAHCKELLPNNDLLIEACEHELKQLYNKGILSEGVINIYNSNGNKIECKFYQLEKSMYHKINDLVSMKYSQFRSNLEEYNLTYNPPLRHNPERIY